tara:strand:- start:4516 stop:5286 length:771 start_codon:yes stop_codon:yes gene_type:complete
MYIILMELKKIKGVEHRLYDSHEEFCAFEGATTPKSDWRVAEEDDWVYTDDKHVVQILKVYYITVPNSKEKRKCVRTICGSFVCKQKNAKILGENGVAENIYTFSGSYDTIKSIRSTKLSSKKLLFAKYVAAGIDMEEAYSRVYPKASAKQYIKNAASKLLQQEKVLNMVKEEISVILKEEGVTPEYIIQKYKDIADISERDQDRLRSLDALAKMSGLFETEKKREELTVWAGFSPEQLEAIKGGKTEVLAHKEKE